MTPVIFINCSGQPFVDQIIAGDKVYETRTRNTLKTLLKSFIGERILIAETGYGKPIVRCSAIIDHYVIIYNKDQWEQREPYRASYKKLAMIPDESQYDWKPDTKCKVLYHLTDVQPVEPFKLPDTCYRHGRVWAEYERSM